MDVTKLIYKPIQHPRNEESVAIHMVHESFVSWIYGFFMRT